MTKNISFKEEANFPYKRISLLGKEIFLYKELTSTNNIARQMAKSGVPEGTIVMCRSQSRGRGRMQRQWFCPPGKGLLLSMVLRPELRGEFLPQLTLLTAVVVAETIKKVTGCVVGIKWPNDIYINGKKVCGILAESNFSSTKVEYVIIGIGLNVNLSAENLPPDYKQTSTSLSIELGHKVSRIKLLRQFIISWDEHMGGLINAGHPYLRRKWIENNITLGENVTVSKENFSIDGLAVDISEKGGLIVRLSNGSLQEFLAEEVTLRKNP